MRGWSDIPDIQSRLKISNSACGLVGYFRLDWISGDIRPPPYRISDKKYSIKNLKTDAKIELNMEFILFLCNDIIILLRLFSISSIYWLYLEIEKHQENFNSRTRDLTQQNFALFGCLMRGWAKKLTKPIARYPNLKLCCLFWTTL